MHMQKERGYIVQEPSEKRFSGMRHEPRHAERPDPDFRDMTRCCAHFDGHDGSGVVVDVQDATAARKQNLKHDQ
jgi:hypothetical protein